MTPQIDYIGAKFWMDLLQLVGIIGIGIFTWWRDRQKVTSKRFKALEEEVAARATRDELAAVKQKSDEKHDEHAGWLNRLTTEVEKIPTRSEHAEISRRIEEVHAELHELTGSIKGLSRAVDLMNEFLINQGGKK